MKRLTRFFAFSCLFTLCFSAMASESRLLLDSIRLVIAEVPPVELRKQGLSEALEKYKRVHTQTIDFPFGSEPISVILPEDLSRWDCVLIPRKIRDKIALDSRCFFKGSKFGFRNSSSFDILYSHSFLKQLLSESEFLDYQLLFSLVLSEDGAKTTGEPRIINMMAYGVYK